MEKTNEELVSEIESLKEQLTEAEDILEAIRKGEVDAFIVKSGNGHELYTLKSADHTYRLFIEKMTEGAVTLNRDGIILYSNSSFAGMINQPLTNVLGKSFLAIIPSSFKQEVGQLIQKAWQEECRGEICLPGKYNKNIPVLLSLNTLEIDGGEGLSIIVTDLSSQKETQHQKEVMDKKDEFISIASHELKTPLTSIKGYIQLLGSNFQQEGNTHAAELLHKADVQINKLTTLVGDLLDVKKIESGQLQYHEEEFDLNELAEEIIEETGRVLSKHTIKSELLATVPAKGDRNKIGQVITNFIDNAGKYSAAHHDIIVKTYYKNNAVGLSVQDTGMGIPKDQQEHVFERFFQVKREKENNSGGMGLGLYISAEIIRRHNGTIGVESEKDKGSTFYFEIPCITQK